VKLVSVGTSYLSGYILRWAGMVQLKWSMETGRLSVSMGGRVTSYSPTGVMCPGIRGGGRW
jgi:hypothetical protein